MASTKKKHSEDLKFEVEKKLDELGVPEPHLFLCEVMAGHDPRGNRGMLAQTIDGMEENEEVDGLPDLEQWKALKLLVRTDPVLCGELVTLEDSIKSAKEALSYMHPKKRAIEVTGEMEHLVKVVTLTKEEIDLFEKRFNDEFC